MSIKFTILGYLIYAAMSGYLLAFIATILRQKRLGEISYLLGFIVALTALIYRGIEVGHLPMQRLVDVFLCMGLIYPLSLFCKHFVRVGAEAADMLIGVIVLLPAGFIFSAEPMTLPPALQSWLFGPHVAVYMLAYIIMAKASVQAILQIIGKEPLTTELINYEEGTYRLIRIGFVFLTMGLLLGSYWGKLAWGDYWSWDPKEMWSLVTWLVYLIYFHFRYMYGRKFPRINSSLALTGMVAVIITLLWANLSRIFAGLHNYAG
ncbi:MAG: cytochrome c biogenesis protein CcsA [Planctomycetota bacterium]|jgi:ABC-type transport system involved in cytochrome c biogenesis permease subunit